MLVHCSIMAFFDSDFILASSPHSSVFHQNAERLFCIYFVVPLMSWRIPTRTEEIYVVGTISGLRATVERS